MNNISKVCVSTRLAFIALYAIAAVVGANHANAQGLPRYTATQDLRIDGDKANLVPIGSLVVDSRAQMFVGQRQDNKILVFDSLGRLVRTIGRKGSGPGEFEGLATLGFIGDTLWAWAEGTRRLTFFKADGRHRRSTNIRLITGSDTRVQPMIRGVRSDGSVLSVGNLHSSRMMTEVHANAKGEVQHQLAVRPISSGGFSFSNYDGGKWELSTDVNPPIIIGAQDGSRLAIATATLDGEEAGTGVVTMLTYSGDTLFKRRYPIAIKPIPRSVIDSTLTAIEKVNPKYAAQLRAFPIGEVYPPLEYMRISRDGALLLAFYTDGPTRDFFLLKPNGEIEASLTLPREVIIRSFDNEHLWGFTRDADDLESIVRFRLQKN